MKMEYWYRIIIIIIIIIIKSTGVLKRQFKANIAKMCNPFPPH